MVFDIDKYKQILESTPERIKALTNILHNSEFTIYKPSEDHFSIKDIIGHLIHGEDDDWIPRIQLILEQDNNYPTFAAFDRFAHQLFINEYSVDELTKRFSSKRRVNIDILNNIEITSALLQKKGIHPALGEVTLEWLLNTWVAHDLSHLNQINRILVSMFDNVGPWREYLRILND